MDLGKLARLVVIAATLGWGSAASADLFVGQVTFEGEENRDAVGRLHFTLDHVSWDGTPYQPGVITRFALESVFGGGFRADLVLIQADDLGQTLASPFPFSDGADGRGLANFGSSGVSADMAQAARNWQVPERAVTGWIIANAQELIELALASGKIGADRAADWAGGKSLFEQFLRTAATPLASAVALADRTEQEARDLTTLHLIPVVQPGLKNLGYYDGAVDGFWGSGTANAAKAFQISLNAVPTGWLTLDQIGQLRQAYGAALTPQAAAVTPWAGASDAQLEALKTEANARIAALQAALAETELALKDTRAAREMAVASLQSSRARLQDLESNQASADTAALDAQIIDLTAALAGKTQQVDALMAQLDVVKSTVVIGPAAPGEDQTDLLTKLQESKETIAALNAQLESDGQDQTVPTQRFNAVRESLTRRVSTLNTMLVQERDNTTDYRNKWFAAQAELEDFQASCAANAACAEAMGLR